MIIKSISHHLSTSAKTLIQYVFDGRKSLLDKDGKSLTIKQNIRGYDKSKWIRQFLALEASRKSKHSRAITMYHEVLSLSPSSTKHTNRDKIKDLVKHYLSLRAKDQMAVVGIHFESDANIHAHILLSGTRLDNYSARISKSDFARIKKQHQAYQQAKYPELSDSIVRHGLKKKMLVHSYSEKEIQLKKRTGKFSEKDVLFSKVKSLFDKSHSIHELERLLAKEQIQTYSRSGKLTGVYYGKRKYRFKRSLGIDIEQLLLKDKAQEKLRSLSELRERKGNSRGIERGL